MGAQEKSPPSSNSTQRVKVYRLNEEGKWDDQGTGHVTVDFLERSEDLGLFVIDEVDNETILLHRISSDDIYRKQEETIISWRDPEYSTELALSFQDYVGASYVWDHICSVQRNSHFSTLNSEVFQNVNNNLRELPTVELSTLPLILKILEVAGGDRGVCGFECLDYASQDVLQVSDGGDVVGDDYISISPERVLDDYIFEV